MIKEFKKGDKIAFSNTRLVLLDFYRPSCAPCRSMEPILEKVSDEIEVVKINVETYAEEASRWHVRGLPTILIVKGSFDPAGISGRGASDPESHVVNMLTGMSDSLTLRRLIASSKGK